MYLNIILPYVNIRRDVRTQHRAFGAVWTLNVMQDKLLYTISCKHMYIATLEIMLEGTCAIVI